MVHLARIVTPSSGASIELLTPGSSASVAAGSAIVASTRRPLPVNSHVPQEARRTVRLRTMSARSKVARPSRISHLSVEVAR